MEFSFLFFFFFVPETKDSLSLLFFSGFLSFNLKWKPILNDSTSALSCISDIARAYGF